MPGLKMNLNCPRRLAIYAVFDVLDTMGAEYARTMTGSRARIRPSFTRPCPIRRLSLRKKANSLRCNTLWTASCIIWIRRSFQSSSAKGRRKGREGTDGPGPRQLAEKACAPYPICGYALARFHSDAVSLEADGAEYGVCLRADSPNEGLPWPIYTWRPWGGPKGL